MLITNKRYIKKHVIGGSGIFDTIKNFFKRTASSSAAKAATKKLSQIAASDLAKKAIASSKNVANQLGTSAIESVADLAVLKGQKLIQKALSPNNEELLKMLTTLQVDSPPAPTPQINIEKPKPIPAPRQKMNQNSKEILASLVNDPPTTNNINNLLLGNGLKNNNAIRIQDLVKMQKGRGLRLA